MTGAIGTFLGAVALGVRWLVVALLFVLGIGLLAFALLPLFGITAPFGPDAKSLSTADLASMAVAGGTLLLAAFTASLAFATGREAEVTRQLMRPRLEVSGAGFGPPPSVTVAYLGGTDLAGDVKVWFGNLAARYVGPCPTPSPSRASQTITLGVLDGEAVQKWKTVVGRFEKKLNLTGQDWFAAVTWTRADGRRYGSFYVQRLHTVEQLETQLP